jgi:hypothetical protein
MHNSNQNILNAAVAAALFMVVGTAYADSKQRHMLAEATAGAEFDLTSPRVLAFAHRLPRLTFELLVSG